MKITGRIIFLCLMVLYSPFELTPHVRAENEPGPEEFGDPVICRVQKGGVFQNFTILDEEPCSRLPHFCKEVNGETSCPVVFYWPSGAETVVEYADKHHTQPIRINGNKAIVPNAIADHTCIVNTKSGNLFCVFERVTEVAKEQIHNDEMTAQPIQPEPSGNFNGIKKPVFERWIEWHGEHVIVEDIRIVQKSEQKIFGVVAIEADFESVVTVKKPYETKCFTVNRCVFLIDAKARLIKPGTYKIESSHVLELRGSEVRMAPD